MTTIAVPGTVATWPEPLRPFIAELNVAAARYAEARTRELALEHDRAAVKRDAILRIMQLTNPLTNRPHSASSAEAVVETDAEYAAYLRDQRIAVMDVILAEAYYRAAQYACDFTARRSEPQWATAGPEDFRPTNSSALPVSPVEPRMF